MARLTVKGHEFSAPNIRDSYDRRSVAFKNAIVDTLKKIGVPIDDVDVPLQRSAGTKGDAVASWYFDERHMLFSYKHAQKFVENLYVVHKVIEAEVKALLNEDITVEEFCQHFAEDQDIEKQRKAARVLLGVEADCIDVELISKKYKVLAKEHHPDAGGDMEEFKKINKAHKMLLRELR